MLIRLVVAVPALLSTPLIIAVGLSQFFAEVADNLPTAANLKGVMSGRRGYLLVGGAAMALAWSGPRLR
tara:strand:+ start:840 stop:1046 length:207 start_codon:yes stop_codon:yes gene_type:complete